MKKVKCPCCGSTLRSKIKKKRFLKAMFFAKKYCCAKCSTTYFYLQDIHKTVVIEKGTTALKEKQIV